MINWLYRLQVFDYDWGLQDDFMGATKLSLTQLELNKPEEIYVKLSDPARPLKDLGELKLIVTLLPKTQEDKEQVNFYPTAIFTLKHPFFVSSPLYINISMPFFE
jgi:hypothetical protein